VLKTIHDISHEFGYILGQSLDTEQKVTESACNEVSTLMEYCPASARCKLKLPMNDPGKAKTLQ
jgi:hypothetical protein